MEQSICIRVGKCVLVVLALLASCSCAPVFAEKTVVELYHPDGSIYAKVFSNKGYDGFKCKVDVEDGNVQHMEWIANKVNSDTVAANVSESNRLLSAALAKALGMGVGR